jgi:glycerate dehydrogenase
MKIVILDGLTTNPGDLSWSGLEELGELRVYSHTPAELVADRAAEADVLIINKVRLTGDLFAVLPKLKLISVLATGYNVIDVAAARQAGVVVSNVPGYSTASVAQHVFAGLLSLLNRPEAHDQAVRRGGWSEANQFSFCLNQQTELAGKTMGIVGMGQIGKKVAELALAFGMKGMVHSRRQPDSNFNPDLAWCSLAELFEKADVISLHCPLNDQTRGMVNQTRISRMKSKAILINTARGELVDEAALAFALNENRIGGAFLDVVTVEPIPENHPLLLAKNCLITPHLAWATIESRRRLLDTTIQNVAGFKQGQPINRVV